jgi:hypothetical protein
MTVLSELDAPRPAAGEGFSDALTYAFADPSTDTYGVARLGLADGRASGLVIVFRDGAPITVAADGGVDVNADSWDDVSAAGLRSTATAPLAAWQLRFDGETPFELTFEATSPAFALAADNPAAVVGGMQGFDQLCRVRGRVGEAVFGGLGQRGRSWGAPDWERMSLARTMTAWLDADHSVSLVAVRPASSRDHDGERFATFHFDADRAGLPVREVALTRLSTTYDGEHRQQRAGLELYLAEDDDFARRLAGEVVAGTSLDLGRLRLHCAFFRWRMEGRVGVGRYDVLERV